MPSPSARLAVPVETVITRRVVQILDRDVEPILASPEFPRGEPELGGVERIADHFRPADLGESPDHGQVLRLEARSGPPRTDPTEPNGAAKGNREGQGRAEDLPSAFSLRAVHCQHCRLALGIREAEGAKRARFEREDGRASPF